MSASLPRSPGLVPGLAYLDVMALGHHHVFLGKELLHSVRRNDVLYLRREGRQVLAACPPGAPRGRQSRVARDTRPPPHQQQQLQGWTPRGIVCKVSLPSWEQGVGVGRVGAPGPGGRQQQLTWLSDVTRCWTIWPSAVVISWM